MTMKQSAVALAWPPGARPAGEAGSIMPLMRGGPMSSGHWHPLGEHRNGSTFSCSGDRVDMGLRPLGHGLLRDGDDSFPTSFCPASTRIGDSSLKSAARSEKLGRDPKKAVGLRL
jgi:hypothetical protein